MSGAATAANRLRQYLVALENRDTVGLNALIGEFTLLENPFLNPARLWGKREIAQAHGEIAGQLESLEFRLEHCLGDAVRAIATGRLAYARRGEDPRDLAVGVVAECDRQGLRRLCLYCDTRDLRRWSDKAIL